MPRLTHAIWELLYSGFVAVDVDDVAGDVKWRRRGRGILVAVTPSIPLAAMTGAPPSQSRVWNWEARPGESLSIVWCELMPSCRPGFGDSEYQDLESVAKTLCAQSCSIIFCPPLIFHVGAIFTPVVCSFVIFHVCAVWPCKLQRWRQSSFWVATPSLTQTWLHA